jgi:hypothetical protein
LSRYTCAENDNNAEIIWIINTPRGNMKYVAKSINATGIRKNGVLLPSPSFLIYVSDAK